MAKNKANVDQISDVPVPEGTLSGDLVIVGVRPGVAQCDRREDGNTTVEWQGQYWFNVIPTAAIDPGNLAYYNPTTKEFAVAAGAGYSPVGFFMDAVPIGSSAVEVRIALAYIGGV